MSILILDLETNGLPNTYKLDYKNTDIWPRIIQFSWGIYDKNSNKLSFSDYLIKPDKFLINKSIHNITNKLANKKGVILEKVIEKFEKNLDKFSCKIIVAHNINFDINVIFAELFRLNNFQLINKLKNLRKICI